MTTMKLMFRYAKAANGRGQHRSADGHLYIQGEDNMAGLAEATPTGYKDKGRFEIPDKGQKSWAHPVISDGRLYVRNQDTLLVYDIKKQKRPRESFRGQVETWVVTCKPGFPLGPETTPEVL